MNLSHRAGKCLQVDQGSRSEVVPSVVHQGSGNDEMRSNHFRPGGLWRQIVRLLRFVSKIMISFISSQSLTSDYLVHKTRLSHVHRQTPRQGAPL